MQDAAAHLAANLKQLRDVRGVTQLQLAKVADVPRATIANLETGAANPTLSVLTRVAASLGVGLDELTAPPRSLARKYVAAELPTQRRGKMLVRKLLPDPLPGLDIERMELQPGAWMAGVPHTAGTREYLTCEHGRIQLAVAGEVWLLDPGDVVVFRGDQKHGYHNKARGVSVAYSVITMVG